MNPNIRTGTVEGTGAALDVAIGFVPDYVEVINVEDGDQIFKWHKGMAADSAIEIRNDAATQVRLIVANGISELDDSSGAGFTLGTAISETGKDLAYLAVRNGAAG